MNVVEVGTGFNGWKRAPGRSRFESRTRAVDRFVELRRSGVGAVRVRDSHGITHLKDSRPRPDVEKRKLLRAARGPVAW